MFSLIHSRFDPVPAIFMFAFYNERIDGLIQEMAQPALDRLSRQEPIKIRAHGPPSPSLTGK